MNLYVRYFDKETLAMSVDEAMAFLASIPEINVDTNAAGRIAAFMAGDSVYPYRLKVSFTNYVLFLKTPANTLEEFKHMEQMRKEQKGDARVGSTAQDRKRSVMDILMDEHPGWYEGTLMFKRVVPIQDTNKFQYKDTRFRARLKARSGMDCYNRIVNHLRNRQDVDPRSQFPSAKSVNFSFRLVKEQEDEASAVAENNDVPAV